MRHASTSRVPWSLALGVSVALLLGACTQAGGGGGPVSLDPDPDKPFVLEGVGNLTEIAKLTGPDAINDTESAAVAGTDLGSMVNLGDKTFLLFGDIYAKGGRLDDAREWYGTAVGIGESSGWKPEVLATARSRLAGAAERVALYQDGDPDNDPPLVGAGNGRGSSCAYCHNK